MLKILTIFTTAFISLFLSANRVNTERGKVLIKNKQIEVPKEWESLLDSTKEVFWEEGNHKPDAGFVLFAKNPSLEGARLWLLRMERKAEVLQEIFPLVKKAQEDLVKEGLLKDRYHVVKAKSSQISKSKNTPTLDGLTFFFLFSSKCPVCQSMSEHLVGLNAIPLQVDNAPLKHFKGLNPSVFATAETTKSYLTKGVVPVLVIFDKKTNQVIVLDGLKTKEEIIIASAELSNKK